MIEAGMIFESTDKRRPRRRVRVIRRDYCHAVCVESRKTEKGWTGYRKRIYLQANTLNPKGHWKRIK